MLHILIKVVTFNRLDVKTFGGWHNESEAVISKLAAQLARQTGGESNEKTRTQSFPIGESFISVKVLPNVFKFTTNKILKKNKYSIINIFIIEYLFFFKIFLVVN